MAQVHFSSATAHPAAPAMPGWKTVRTVPQAGQPPVQLVRQATPPGGLRYTLVSFWEERCLEVVKRTTIDKDLTLHWELVPDAPAIFTYEAAPPVLQQPSLTALEKALLLLATLYQRLEMEVTPAGQLLALRNHPEILRTWATVREELIRRSGGDDDLTQSLLRSVGAQLQQPEAILASLRHDYAFAFLLPDLYRQRFESGFGYEQARELPLFFTDTSLWFQEQLVVAPAVPGRVLLRAHGALQAGRTDLVAVARQVDAAFAAANLPAGPTAPDTVRATYEATFDLDPATGWPVAVEVSVVCRAADTYSKEYFLRFEQSATL
jgi:hypothetical protein